MAADAANCLLRGDDPAAVAAADRKIAEAGALIDALPGEQVAVHLDMLLSLSIARMFSGDYDGSNAAAERGLALARETRQGLLTPAFVSVLGFVDQELGRLDSAEAHLEEALDSALLSGNVQVAYWASLESSVVALLRGRIESALEHGQVAWELLGTREYSQAGFVVADARLSAGDPAGARAALEAFGWVRPQMWTLDRVKAAEIAVRVLLALGLVDEAAAWADRVPLEGGGRRTGIFGALAARARAGVLLATGAPGEAARVAAAGAAEADKAHAAIAAGCCRTLEGEALAAAGDEGAARERATCRRGAARRPRRLRPARRRPATAAQARRAAAAAGARHRRRRRSAPRAADAARARGRPGGGRGPHQRADRPPVAAERAHGREARVEPAREAGP